MHSAQAQSTIVILRTSDLVHTGHRPRDMCRVILAGVEGGVRGDADEENSKLLHESDR
jgi:hypothetical protein